MGKHRKPSDSRTARRMGLGVATATLGITGLGLSATTAQAATTAPAASSSEPSADEFFQRSYEKCLDDQRSSGLAFEEQLDACTGKLREGPGAPDADHPGANFDRATYEETAQLPNDQFIDVRNKVLDAAPDGELQRSFYSNGCTAIPADTISQQTMDACIQHDFRYTVGPNVYQDDPEAAEKERREADKQLGDNIGGRAGDLFHTGTQVAGNYFFQPTPTGEQNASELLP